MCEPNWWLACCDGRKGFQRLYPRYLPSGPLRTATSVSSRGTSATWAAARAAMRFMNSRRLRSPPMNSCVSDWTESRLTILVFLLYPGATMPRPGLVLGKGAPYAGPQERFYDRRLPRPPFVLADQAHILPETSALSTTGYRGELRWYVRLHSRRNTVPLNRPRSFPAGLRRSPVSHLAQ